MNCLNTRRVLQVTPQENSAEITQHLAECEACRQFAARLQREEHLLAAAVAVPVPEQLAERILLRTQMQSRAPSWWQRLRALVSDGTSLLLTRPLPVALAASSVFAIALTWKMLIPDANLNWNEVLLAHAASETDAELTSHQAIAGEVELQRALNEYGLQTIAGLGKVRSLARCLLPGGRGVHVVIDTPDLGQLTLILPPKGIKTQSQLASLENYTGQVIQINQASVGIMSQDRATIAALIGRVQQRVVALG